MTAAELIERLKALASVEPEQSHWDADLALLEYIDNPEITEAFKALERWYS